MSALLSVNVNKIALLRNSRGADFPNVLKVSQDLIKCGAHGITIHPRPDERHAKYADAYELKKNIDVELNIEGYPNEKFLDMVCEVKPAQCTLVPDAPDAITSNAGWDCKNNLETLKPIIARLKAAGARTSIFLDPDPEQVPYAVQTGTDRIELYTEEFARSYGTDRQTEVMSAYKITAEMAVAEGLGVNAGHDLSLENLKFFDQSIDGLLEVSIGHALVVEMLYKGMNQTVSEYLEILS
ncbi:MAG: pyridoxine 5'-phosphate synthase [Lentisphaeraceae bacterium]|nr:pyridoxine 5'-phosphate synthase [Lentisphaeraceae bacterium]